MRTRLQLASWVALSLALGCAVGPDFVRPDAPSAQGYAKTAPPEKTVEAAGVSQRFVPDAELSPRWWKLLGSPPLDAMVDDAVKHNLDLKVAEANLHRSQDAVRAGYGVFFPELDGKAGAVRQKYNPAPGVLPSSVFNLFTLSATVSYTFDVWGGERRQLESLQADAEQQRYGALGTWLMLTGNVVNTVVARAAYQAQVEATQASIALEREQLRVTRAQVEAGTVSRSNVLTLESQLASTESLVPPLAQKVDQADHLLAVLAGQLPSEGTAGAVTLTELSLPQEVPVTLPSKLVRQRPDVLAAEAALRSANAKIGVATAAMLPNVTLTGGVGVANTKIENLFNPASLVASVAGGLTAPLFHGGTLWYERREAIDTHDAATLQYRQTVLIAFEQVADLLGALEHDAQSLRANAEAMRSAEEALKLVQAEYQAGIANYLQVLVANQQYLQTKTGYIEAQAQRLQDTVALYLALGGGWWNEADDELRH